jgi:hypothetical protein
MGTIQYSCDFPPSIYHSWLIFFTTFVPLKLIIFQGIVPPLRTKLHNVFQKIWQTRFDIPGGTHYRHKGNTSKSDKGYILRSISRSLGIHKDTIKNYILISIDLGVDPTEGAITDELTQKRKSRLIQGESPLHIPRDDIPSAGKG